MTKYLYVTVNTPLSHTDQVREAIGKAGAGKVGSYGFVSFSIRGTGRGLALEGANPAYGDVGKLEQEEEEKIETFCKKEDLEKIIKAIKDVHPYEEPAITVYPVEIF